LDPRGLGARHPQPGRMGASRDRVRDRRGPSPGTWTGLAGMAEGFRDWLGAWKDLRFDVDHYRELDDERVLVLIHYHGRGKASGVDLGEIGATSAQLYHVRDGKVTRWVSYWDRERAFADVGLASEDGADSP